jgi:toxin ParE1/3/4
MILLTSAANADVRRVRNFLQAKNPDAARRALREVWATLRRVEQFPEIGKPTKDPDIRQIAVPFGRAGYIVRYRILPPDGAVLVTRIWHMRENRV